MTPAELAAIRARVEAATPGPWVALGTDVAAEVKGCTCYGGQAPYGHEQFCGLEGPLITGAAPSDAALIAHAPTDLTALLDEVDRLTIDKEALTAGTLQLTARLAAVRELHRECRKSCCAGGTICDHCEMRWPCPTIQAIDDPPPDPPTPTYLDS